MNNNTPMTTRGYELIKTELDKLIKVEREAIKKAISEARELGDLKENSEYHAAKEKQSAIEGRILELQSNVSTAQVIDISNVKNDKIVFGATVTLYNPEKEQSNTYQIVGTNEAREDGKISYCSPLGKALIGKEEGDSVSFKAPKGLVEYEVESVEYS